MRSFACFCHFCIRSAPKRAADRASHPFATKAHRIPRQNPIRSSALGQRLRSRSCPRGVLSISPGGGVLFKTKDERRKTGRLRPPHSAETARKNPPPPPHRPETGVVDISAPIHTRNAIFTLQLFAFFSRFLTQSLSVFASAHGRTKYQLFRTVRPFSHPLATKARRRQRQNPLRNCALFRVYCTFLFPLSIKAHRRPRLHCALFRPSVRRRAIAASPRLLLRVCLSPRGVLSISPGGGVLFKTKGLRPKA